MAKYIAYMAPVEWLVGNVSGQQLKTYGTGHVAGYDVPTGDVMSADGYQPRLVAKRIYKSGRRYFQVRTKTSVNMTVNARHAMALMGGACAIYSSLLRNKSADIYNQCVNSCPKGVTLRGYIIPLLRAGLAGKVSNIAIADGVTIVNPWVSAATPNVPVSQTILDKFASELTNS